MPPHPQSDRLYRPMLLTPTKELPVGKEWSYEFKFDGFRAMGYARDGQARMRSREGNDLSDICPQVMAELPNLIPGHDFVVDGELLAIGANGQPEFNALRRKNSPKLYVIFDLLRVGDTTLLHLPLTERRQIMRELFQTSPGGSIQLCDVFDDRDDILLAAETGGEEGVIAKRLNSIYRPGIRSRDWLKRVLRLHRRGPNFRLSSEN